MAVTRSPGANFPARQAWLKNVQWSRPVSSCSTTSAMERPRRGRRVVARTTSAVTTASSPSTISSIFDARVRSTHRLG